MRSPKVQIRDVPHSGQQVVWCHEDACPWVYVAAVKSDAEYRARAHRAEHRKAAERA